MAIQSSSDSSILEGLTVTVAGDKKDGVSAVTRSESLIEAAEYTIRNVTSPFGGFNI